ncbi:AAA-16 domain-containing protein [Mycena sanguinolenta]|uniref:AAA-16 domain-containing protein n=1 Tax=Mycena sanguinolenta TaxID=230812 RepID=A0A8H6X5A1_9AGAR|nr:AAA-16 domain-containing protein [Mycena sanguinolenta]
MSSQAFDVVLDITPTIFDLAEDVVSLLPIPGLVHVVKGLSGIVDAVKASGKARVHDGARRAFMDQVTTLSNTLKNILKRTGAAAHDAGDAKDGLIQDINRSEALRSRIQTLERTIDELGISVNDLKRGRGVYGFLKAVIYSARNEETITDMKDKLASAIQIFKFEEQLSIEIVLDHVIRTAEETRKAQEGEGVDQNYERYTQSQIYMTDDGEVLDAIPRESAGYRCVDELKSGFFEGTRGELLKELISWSRGEFPEDDPKRIYFLSGRAGLGKSSIAHRLCVLLGEPTLGASFFFGRGDMKSTRRFFSTLAHQFAMSQPLIRPHIVNAAREYYKQDQEQQMRYAFKELLQSSLASASLATHSPVIIVIDGLDELNEQGRISELLNFLFKIARVQWIRIFITSRPEPHILSMLTSAEVAPMIYHRRLEDTLHEWAYDVRYYLVETISKMSPYSDFIRDNPQFLTRLIRRVGGVFMLARIAVEFLKANCDHPDPKEQFELLLSSVGDPGLSDLDVISDVTSSVRTLAPPNFDAVYLQILISAFPPQELHDSSSRRVNLQSFLTIIALQRRTMTPEAMGLLWPGLSKGYIVWMRDRLRSALVMDKERYVSPLNATFGQFLVDQDRCTDPLYCVRLSTGQAKLAMTCIAAFTFEKISGYLTAANGALVEKFINYAVSNWNVHLQQAEVNDELKERMKQLIDCQMPCYTRAFGWSERGVCSGIRAWLKDSKDAAQISLKYAKSAAYSKLWWEMALKSSNLRTDTGATPPDITINAENISQKMLSIFDSGEIPEEQQVVVTSSDIERYEAVHKELVKRIQRENMQKFWFNPELGRRR